MATPLHPRLKREHTTIGLMIAIFCRDHHHGTAELCQECRELLAYAQLRLQHCPFQEGKTTCGKCAIHCYKPAMRRRIQTVMRHAGPRMAKEHPLLALEHLLDGLRRKPKPVKKDKYHAG